MGVVDSYFDLAIKIWGNEPKITVKDGIKILAI